MKRSNTGIRTVTNRPLRRRPFGTPASVRVESLVLSIISAATRTDSGAAVSVERSVMGSLTIRARDDGPLLAARVSAITRSARAATYERISNANAYVDAIRRRNGSWEYASLRSAILARNP